MISVESAKSCLLTTNFRLEGEQISLFSSCGRILSDDVLSPVDHPPFNQTAVDGFAFGFDSYISGTPLVIAGEIAAGDEFPGILNAGTCVRIYTGARIPSGGDTVVMQEHVNIEIDSILLQDPKIKKGKNVRKKAEQIASGEIAMIAGSVIKADAIGFLASIGAIQVSVARRPHISVTVTGNEFAASLDELKHGKVFESNGGMLQAALAKEGIQAQIQRGPDDPEKLKSKIGATLDQSDIIIVTGGVSVGRYDFTREVLTGLGFEIIFHQVSQKPGKPMLFARKGNQFAFGLPGNPRAVMIGFYEYILPFIRCISGCPAPFLHSAMLPLKHEFLQDPGRAQFLAAGIDKGGVEILDGQGSHMLQSMAMADAIVYIPADVEFIGPGELVEVHLPIL